MYKSKGENHDYVSPRSNLWSCGHHKRFVGIVVDPVDSVEPSVCYDTGARLQVWVGVGWQNRPPACVPSIGHLGRRHCRSGIFNLLLASDDDDGREEIHSKDVVKFQPCACLVQHPFRRKRAISFHFKICGNEGSGWGVIEKARRCLVETHESEYDERYVTSEDREQTYSQERE